MYNKHVISIIMYNTLFITFLFSTFFFKKNIEKLNISFWVIITIYINNHVITITVRK